MHERERSDLSFHQPMLYEPTTQATLDDPASPIRRPSLANIINKRPSIVIGQCPFSGHKIEVEAAAI